jgi:NADH-quinone oxidoreductase subunit C
MSDAETPVAAAAGAAPPPGPAAPGPAAPEPAAPEPAAPKPPWEREPVAPLASAAEEDTLVVALRAEHGATILSARRFAGELTVVVERTAIAVVAAHLKRAHGFTYLIDICGADYPQRSPRFEVVYHLHAFADHRRLRLKLATGEADLVPTLTGVFVGAGWPEREVFDLYGVRFAGHPDLSRILTWDGFNGHPLRKDFPVEGIDTGAAVYPERFGAGSGPLNKAGTGWLVKDSEAGD